MRVDEAKQLVLDLIARDMVGSPMPVSVQATSPDPQDPGKFLLAGRPARAIHHFSGWFAPINLDWFAGSLDQPVIHRMPFYWYVFAIPRGRRYRRDHYLVCDYLQMRSWVLDFGAPLGRDHRDHNLWRADLRLFLDDPTEATGYFRWGDEPAGIDHRPSRVFHLDNVNTILDVALTGEWVGTFGPGGESAAHRRLKLYVATHATDFGLREDVTAHVEYAFRTGDRVDVMFENHLPNRTVVEVEVQGEQNVCVGIHQAVKYRALAEVDAGYPIQSPRVHSLVVAYDTEYQRAHELASQYDVSLASVSRELVLANAV